MGHTPFPDDRPPIRMRFEPRVDSATRVRADVCLDRSCGNDILPAQASGATCRRNLPAAFTGETMNHTGICLAIAVPLVFVGAIDQTGASPSPGSAGRSESTAAAHRSDASPDAASMMMDGGGALLDYVCVKNGVTIGQCGNEPRLLAECDSNWANACSNAGGSSSSCAGGTCSSETIKCKDDSALYHASDEGFIISCENVNGGDFDCTNWDGEPPNCTDGTCTI